MKVLFVTRNFPPTTGGMERFLYHAYAEIARDHDTALVGPAGCAKFVSTGTSVSSVPLFPIVSFLVVAQFHAYRMAREYAPDLVVSGSSITAPAALFAARVAGAKSLCFVYGLDLVADNFFYRMSFIPMLRRFDQVLSISQNTTRLAEKVGIDSRKIGLLHPGVTLPAEGHQLDSSAFRKLADAEGRVILLSVGRLSERKGMAEFIERSMPTLIAQRPDIKLVIIGAEPEKALRHARGQTQRIQDAIKSNGLEQHVTMLGRVDDGMLSQAYASSTILVFPVLDVPGDTEGFGMVAIEAAAHGLPTAAFAAGGVPDAVHNGVSGYLATPGNYPELSAMILTHLLHADNEKWRTQCIAFAKEFSWDRFGERFRSICLNLVSQ